MSMHLRGSSDIMMRNEDEGWWTSRTGLEQKLIILSTILFIVCFSLTITVIVYKKNSNTGECTTVAPPTTAVTDTSPASGSTSPSSEPPSTSPVPESSSISSTPETSPPSSTSEVSSPTTPETSSSASSSDQPSEPTAKVSESGSLKVEREMIPVSESSPLMALLKEAKRVNDVLDKHREEKLRGA